MAGRGEERLELVTAHRINVLGASGSGATTVGRALASALSLPCFDCDDYFHAPSDPPFTAPRAPDERHALIVSDLGPTESWVLAGGVAGWTPYPKLDFTLVVFLWIPAEIRIERLRRREQERFGARIQAGGDMNELHEEFIAWASRYDAGDVEGKTRARHEAWLAAQSCPVVAFHGAFPAERITDAVVALLGHSGGGAPE